MPSVFLSDEVHKRVSLLAEVGSQLFDHANYKEAIEKWNAGLDLLPQPKTDWDAAMWLYASVGDAFFQQGNFAEARESFLDCLNCPIAQTNAFVHLRLGQSSINLGIEGPGIDHLLKAYMLSGSDIFLAETTGEEYLTLLRDRNLI